MPLFPLLWLFFCYSFLGWVLETAVSAVRLHRYVDRSVLFGPLCACYGITAVLLTVGLPELRGNYFFLFLGSAICSTVVEWIAGHLLEKATHTRWWDYSNRPGADKGCLQTSGSVFSVLPLPLQILFSNLRLLLSQLPAVFFRIL